jgi:Lon protease-like protein
MSDELPLFPLHVVLFPGAFLPLRIFELRYRRLVDECGRDNPFVVVRIREGKEAGEPAFTFQTGVRVRFVELVSQRDGSLGVMVQAMDRVRLHDFRVEEDGLMFASVEGLPEDGYVSVPQDLQALADALEQQEGESVPDAGTLAWRLAERLPLSLDDKQHLLELNDVDHRVERVRGWLIRHPGWFSA